MKEKTKKTLYFNIFKEIHFFFSFKKDLYGAYSCFSYSLLRLSSSM